MIIDLILLILGIVIVLKGADFLTDGSVAVARRFHMSEMIIGMTIIAFGTSMPEFCVSLVSALNGTADMAVGNVVGSNIFNMFLIIGICAMIRPMSVQMDTIKRDLPFSFLASIMFIYMLIDGTLSRRNGALLFIAFVAYLTYTLWKATKGSPLPTSPGGEEEKNAATEKHPAWSLVLIVLGLSMLVLGSDLFVDHASALARTLGVPEAIVGLTILGFGTSLPELATSVIAAYKGSTAMALGNVIGSAVFNIMFALGLTAIISPLAPQGITAYDLGMMFLGSLLMWFFSYTNKTMERWEGAVLTILFIAYMAFLLVTL